MNTALCDNGSLTHSLSLENSIDLPSLEKYTSVLHRCRKEKNLAFANLVHTHLCGNGLEAHKAIGNHLVPMFVECGSAVYAQQVFNRILDLNEFSWTALIEGYTENGNAQHALSLYKKMKEDHVSPTRFTFMALLKACTKLKCLEKGREIHLAVIENEYESDHFIGSSLLGMYAKCGSLIEAHDVFEEIPIQDLVSWTVLISAYVDHGLAAKALEFYQKMLDGGLAPDRVTYVYILKACGMLKAFEKGRNVHEEIREQGFKRDPNITSALIDMYIKCGAVTSAMEVFDDLVCPDVALWNVLIAGFVDQGFNEEALDLYNRMKREGVSPDATTFVYSLKACASSQSVDMGVELHNQIDVLGFKNDPFIGPTLVDMYSKFGLLETAQETFDSLPIKEVVLWTALISGYSEHGYHEQALSCFRQMQVEGMEPDSVTFMCCLRSVSSLGIADIGQELHASIIEESYDQDERLGSSLVTMYVKCGLVAEAQDVFFELEDPDLVSWTALITSYAELGHGEAALEIFQKMQATGLCPDAVTFVSILKACCSIESLNYGQVIHNEIIKEEFEGLPFIANSLMDLYVKCGHISEAYDIFNELPSQDTISWTVLINGYMEEGLAEEALIAYRKMQSKEVSPNPFTLSCILRACGNLGEIEDGLQIHCEIIMDGFEKDSHVSSSLVGMYAKGGLLEEAKDTYSEFPAQDASLWNALVLGYIEQGLDEEALAFIKREAICLNETTYTSSLKAYGFAKALADGQALHIEIIKRGFDQDHFIGNALVDFYIRCSLLVDAQIVFDKLFVRDIVLWNTLAAGYAEAGLDVETLQCLGNMQDEGVLANATTYACIVGLYGNVGIVHKGQELHQEMVMKGIETIQLTANALLGMYAKCGLLAEAQEVFDKLSAPDLVCWNALITGYAEHGSSEEVLNCLDKMQVPANAATYVNSLKACKTTVSLGTGRKVHALIAEEGYEEDALIGNSLVDMYVSCGSMQEAKEVFEELQVCDVFAWTALIVGYTEKGSNQEALNCYERMKQDGISPDVVTLVCSLQACGNLQAVDKVQVIHLELAKKGYEKDSSVSNHLVQTYAKCSLIPEAQEVFDGLFYQSVVSWTALITAYSDRMLYHEAFNMLEKMELDGISSDVVTFVCIFRALAGIGDICKGQSLHMVVTKRGFEGDPRIGNSLVGMYAKCESLEEAHYVFDRLAVQDVVSWTALMGGLSEHGVTEEALECFQVMQCQGVLPDTVSWNAILLGFVKQEQTDKAHLYFKLMLEQGLLPSSTIYLTMTKAYGTTASLDAGRRCHVQMNSFKWETNEVMLTAALIDMYGKCGEMFVAEQLFNGSTSLRNVSLWNALVAGYTSQGQSELAFFTLERMINSIKSIQPDDVTFVTAITACSHVGLVELGQSYFQCMNKDYDIEPVMKHYNCLLDLLGRAGQVDEAVSTIQEIPFEVDFVVWSTVLGACQKWGDLDVARRAFKQAMKLEEDHAAMFVLMSNLSVVEEYEGITSMA